ncbi:hypothetical protein [Kitasatospora sp. NPDC004289]
MSSFAALVRSVVAAALGTGRAKVADALPRLAVCPGLRPPA